jgi:hypothetical protein
MRPDEVARRLDNRAGYELITYREIGLPIFGISATALLLERQERSCIEEFALRFINAGLDAPDQIRGALGLPAKVVDSALAELVRQEALRTAMGGEKLILAERGKDIVEEADMFLPSEQTIWFAFDGLLRKPKWYGSLPFLKPQEAHEAGLPMVNPIPGRGPEVEELSAADVSEVVRLTAGASRGEHEVLRVRSIEKRVRQFLPAIALVYRSLSGSGIQVGFAIDGRVSQEHELAFSRSGGLERQPIFEGLDEKVVVGPIQGLSGRIEEWVAVAEEQRSNMVRIIASRSALEKAALAVATAESAADKERAVIEQERAGERLADSERDLRVSLVRRIAVYDHPAILEDALVKAKERVLIISPWIRRAVVDTSFLRAIRIACGRGVKVTIGFGLGASDPSEKAWDAEARENLEKLSTELPLLIVRRLGDTHAKILIKDSEFFVITSFNWLSFRGDLSKPFREEWGTMVREQALVDEFYAEMIQRFLK